MITTHARIYVADRLLSILIELGWLYNAPGLQPGAKKAIATACEQLLMVWRLLTKYTPSELAGENRP